jgi:hypothetical protein
VSGGCRLAPGGGANMNRCCGWVAYGALSCLAWTAPCSAAGSLAGLLACRDLADAASRLACYDRESAALAPAPKAPGPSAAASPAGASSATPPSAAAASTAASTTAHPALDAQQKFGLSEHTIAEREGTAGTRASGAIKIEAHIARVAPGADGRFAFTLDNDQVWRQLSAEGDLLARQGDAVTISHGLLSSYWLQMKSGRGCKVTRLR